MARAKKSEPDETIGQRSARRRKERGITQTELASELGVAQSHVSEWERGSLRLHGELIAELTRLLGVSADELMELTALGQHSTTGNLRLVRRLHDFDKLSKRDQEAPMRTIDAPVAQNRVKQAVAGKSNLELRRAARTLLPDPLHPGVRLLPLKRSERFGTRLELSGLEKQQDGFKMREEVLEQLSNGALVGHEIIRIMPDREELEKSRDREPDFRIVLGPDTEEIVPSVADTLDTQPSTGKQDNLIPEGLGVK